MPTCGNIAVCQLCRQRQPVWNCHDVLNLTCLDQCHDVGSQHKLPPRLTPRNCYKVYSLNLIHDTSYSPKVIVAGLPFCPLWLHTLLCLNSSELHCWLSSHPHCIKMLGLCFRVYVRRSQGAGTDPAKDSMPRACRRGQGLPSDLPKDSLCLHLVVIDCRFVVRKVIGMTLPKTSCPGHAVVS